MDYLKKAEKEIREEWFKDHSIKTIEGVDGFQRISFGKKGTRFYQVDYVLSDNMVYITGDLGDAVYSLTCQATLDNIKGDNLSYFTSKVTAHERSRWIFDSDLAQKDIEEYIFDWCDVDNVDGLDEEERELYDELMSATTEWSSVEHFQTAVYSIYDRTNISWFDGEAAGCIADCGQRLNRVFVAYWLGLQMIIEELDKHNSIPTTA